jgi:hypothetical protein
MFHSDACLFARAEIARTLSEFDQATGRDEYINGCTVCCRQLNRTGGRIQAAFVGRGEFIDGCAAIGPPGNQFSQGWAADRSNLQHFEVTSRLVCAAEFDLNRVP